MTAQVPERVRFEGVEYQLTAVECNWPFSPGDHGFEPEMIHTACYRGFICLYAVDSEDKLVLDELHINQLDRPGEWLGVEPEEDGKEGCLVYRGVDYPIEYSGGIIISTDFIDSLYIHMGYQSPYAFETVKELIFQEGELQEAEDHSEFMAEIREAMKRGEIEEGSRGEIVSFVNRSFSLSYEDKWFI